MAEELEEIWTNYDRQTVTNYVETRLHHYLFTKIFKDEAEIMSKIIEINALELRAFKIEHFLSIAETQDLIGNFNKLEEMLEGKDVTTSPYCEILGVIKYMFENIKNDDSGSIKNKNFDADKLDEINADILENKKAISSILKSDLFADIQTPDIIDVNLLEVAAKNTDEIYNLARVYEVYDELFVFPTKLELYNAIVDVILKAMSNDKLFELYVLLNTLEALEKTKGKITFQKAGVRELAEIGRAHV